MSACNFSITATILWTRSLSGRPNGRCAGNGHNWPFPLADYPPAWTSAASTRSSSSFSGPEFTTSMISGPLKHRRPSLFQNRPREWPRRGTRLPARARTNCRKASRDRRDHGRPFTRGRAFLLLSNLCPHGGCGSAGKRTSPPLTRSPIFRDGARLFIRSVLRSCFAIQGSPLPDCSGNRSSSPTSMRSRKARPVTGPGRKYTAARTLCCQPRVIMKKAHGTASARI